MRSPTQSGLLPETESKTEDLKPFGECSAIERSNSAQLLETLSQLEADKDEVKRTALNLYATTAEQTAIGAAIRAAVKLEQSVSGTRDAVGAMIHRAAKGHSVKIRQHWNKPSPPSEFLKGGNGVSDGN